MSTLIPSGRECVSVIWAAPMSTASTLSRPWLSICIDSVAQKSAAATPPPVIIPVAGWFTAVRGNLLLVQHFRGIRQFSHFSVTSATQLCHLLRNLSTWVPVKRCGDNMLCWVWSVSVTQTWPRVEVKFTGHLESCRPQTPTNLVFTNWDRTSHAWKTAAYTGH